MTNTIKSLPWLISVVLAVLLVWSWHTSQQKLMQKDAELTETKQQYNQLLTDANSKITLLTEEANEKLHLANQPEIPVDVSFRKALLSSGDVASFRNRSSRSIAVTASIERPSSGQSRIFDLTLDPGHTKEIGEREGWAFVSGDTVTLTQPEHKSLSFQAP